MCFTVLLSRFDMPHEILKLNHLPLQLVTWVIAFMRSPHNTWGCCCGRHFENEVNVDSGVDWTDVIILFSACYSAACGWRCNRKNITGELYIVVRNSILQKIWNALKNEIIGIQYITVITSIKTSSYIS